MKSKLVPYRQLLTTQDKNSSSILLTRHCPLRIFKLGGKISTLSTILLLCVTSLASAETPSRTIRDSQILPYLLDNPNDNSLVRVRCVSKSKQEIDSKRRIIRDSLLRSDVGDVYRQAALRLRNETVTIEIEGSCRNVKIRVQDGSDFSDYPNYNPHLNDNHTEFEDSSWLTREGSGWYWLLHRR